MSWASDQVMLPLSLKETLGCSVCVPPTLVTTHHWLRNEATAPTWRDGMAQCMQVQLKYTHQHNQPSNQQESAHGMLEFEVTVEIS